MQRFFMCLFRNISLVLIFLGASSSAWISSPSSRCLVPHFGTTTTRLYEVLQGPDGVAFGLREAGDQIIRDALIGQGCSDDQFQIEWKLEKIIVTVKGPTYVHDDKSDDEEEDDVESDEVFGTDMDMDSEAVETSEIPMDGTNIVELSRAIRVALELDGTIGVEIGEKFEIEVTTPGAPDELSGIMFQSYRGFDVIVEYFDAKKDKIVFLDCRFVERNEEQTVINMKGRIKNLPNDVVKAVRLPKAKKEKGG